jgi:hypothetical protein
LQWTANVNFDLSKCLLSRKLDERRGLIALSKPEALSPKHFELAPPYDVLSAKNELEADGPSRTPVLRDPEVAAIKVRGTAL